MTESKGKYNFTDCKPISKTDQKNKVKLWNKYNKILQKDKVYKDIEMWSSYNSDESTQEIRFSGKRIIWANYNNSKETYLTKQEFQEEYYRVIQLFCHHGPVNVKYKDILLKYTELGKLDTARKEVNKNITFRQIYYYLQVNLDRMLAFAREFLKEKEKE